MVAPKWVINSHKALTVLVLIWVLWAYDAWNSPSATIYTSIHGTYCVHWLLKGLYFPDKNFEQDAPWFAIIPVVYGGLSVFVYMPVAFISQHLEASVPVLAAATGSALLGTFFHYCSDMQKHVHLQMKRELITDGMWGLSRNINYFGEFLIYGGLVAISSSALQAWWPLVYYALYIGLLWVPGMLRKDASLSRYPAFAAYKKKTRMFVPFLA